MTSEEFRKRLQSYKAYQNHPLKNQYREEKEKLIKSLNKTPKMKKLRIIRLVMIVLIGVYFWALNYFFGHDICAAIVIAGIVNLILIYIVSRFKNSCIKNSDVYVQFIEKYRKLGLREFESYDVAKGGCIDYSNISYARCPVTGEIITDEKLEECRKTGAYKCEIFERALCDD